MNIILCAIDALRYDYIRAITTLDFKEVKTLLDAPAP